LIGCRGLAGFRFLSAVGNLCCHLLCFYFLFVCWCGNLAESGAAKSHAN
jgi:hypothetical protein